MSLNLVKGERIDLTKNNPGLKHLQVCLGWDVKSNPSGEDFDLDASAFLLGAGDKLVEERDVIFYKMDRIDASGNIVDRKKYEGRPDEYAKAGKLMHYSGSVVHTGDDRTGAGDITHSKDKEIIEVDLSKIPADKTKIAFVATIYDAVARQQKFGLVGDAFIRIVDADNKIEIMKFDLTENFSTATAIIVGEVYKKDGEWKFAAIGTGLPGGLKELIEKYGLKF